jgi:hypothetical protein
LSKCRRRNIIEENKSIELLDKAEKIIAMLNAYIRFVAKSQKITKTANTAITD